MGTIIEVATMVRLGPGMGKKNMRPDTWLEQWPGPRESFAQIFSESQHSQKIKTKNDKNKKKYKDTSYTVDRILLLIFSMEIHYATTLFLEYIIFFNDSFGNKIFTKENKRWYSYSSDKYVKGWKI